MKIVAIKDMLAKKEYLLPAKNQIPFNVSVDANYSHETAYLSVLGTKYFCSKIVAAKGKPKNGGSSSSGAKPEKKSVKDMCLQVPSQHCHALSPNFPPWVQKWGSV